jgi:hypothetical protein
MFPNNNSILFRDIYTFVFKKTNTIYIGLTCNTKRRFKEHMRRDDSPVFRYIKKTNDTYDFNVITDSPLSEVEASKKECDLINEYLLNGWNILNAKLGGGLGGSLQIWNYDNLRCEALKYKTKVDFRKYSPKAYHASNRLKVIDNICGHMVKLYPNWTYEELSSEAKKYKHRGEFLKNSKNAYNQSRRRGLLDDVCSHMTPLYTVWSNDLLISESKKYKSRSEFIKNCPGGYESANNRGILDEICSHMKTRVSWTLDSMIETAKKYESIKILRDDHEYAYRKLLKLGIIYNIFPSDTKISSIY